MEFRVGFSKDIHRLAYGRKLIIAGVTIPHYVGELAHSDGDVVYHALAESIFGALALGDLGKFFPDNIEETRNMDSSLIVKKAVSLMKELHYSVSNVDILISLEQPKIRNYIDQMRANIAYLLETDINQISVKAGTNEGMDSVGRGESIEAYSYLLLQR